MSTQKLCGTPRAVGEAQIRVCVLERVSIARTGHAAAPIGAMQQKVMLTLLVAYADRSVSVDRIGEELWGDDKPRRWLASIRTLANSLRRVAGDKNFIHWTGRGYRLHKDRGVVETDIDHMLWSLDQARAALYEGRLGDAEHAARRALSFYGSGPWTTDCWYWSDLAADAYHLLGRALLGGEKYLRCLLELSTAPEELAWHDGVGACLRQAREAMAAAPV
ncbi:MAG: AfsR/SARP family transcriptional regulator [Acidimicrobiales bacterium]